MVRKEFQIDDGEDGRHASEKYTIIKGCIDGREDMYEFVSFQEGNEGDLSVYRDRETKATLALEHDRSDLSGIVLVCDEGVVEKSIRRLHSVVPTYFEFEPCD